MTSPTSLALGKKHLWLAAETSGHQGSLCIAETDGIKLGDAWEVWWDKKATHSEIATEKLQELFKMSGKGFSDLTALVINAGPGSFTGLRVGVNLIRTIAYTLNLPVMMLGSLSVLAFGQGETGEKVLVAIKAIQNFYYAAGYEILNDRAVEILSPQSLDLVQLNSLSSAYTKVLIEGQTEDFTTGIMAGHLIEDAVQAKGAMRLFSWNDVNPLYIRASEAEEKMRKGLLKPL